MEVKLNEAGLKKMPKRIFCLPIYYVAKVVNFGPLPRHFVNTLLSTPNTTPVLESSYLFWV